MYTKRAILFFAILFSITLSSQAQISMETIELPTPDKERVQALISMFQEKGVSETLASEELSYGDMSDLLWYVSRKDYINDNGDDQKSTLIDRKIDIYILVQEGAFLYDPIEHVIRKVSKKDLRLAANGQGEPFSDAPTVFLLVANNRHLNSAPVTAKMKEDCLNSADAICANFHSFCNGNGMFSAKSQPSDAQELEWSLKLPDNCIPLLNSVIGYSKN